MRWKTEEDISFPIYPTAKLANFLEEAAMVHLPLMLHYENQIDHQWNLLYHHRIDNKQLNCQKSLIILGSLVLPHAFSFIPAQLELHWHQRRFSFIRFCFKDNYRWYQSILYRRWPWKAKATFLQRCFTFHWISNKLQKATAIRSCSIWKVSRRHSFAHL